MAPKPVPEFEDVANEARSAGGKQIKLNEKQNKRWQEGLKKAAKIGKSKDLTLEVESDASGEETPGAYVSDHSADGFNEPITVYRTLHHEP